jgi:nucleoside-diphosphate-sugar epimerase
MGGNRTFFCFGLGFSGLTVARHLMAQGWAVGGTCREPDRVEQLKGDGIKAHVFDGTQQLDDFGDILSDTTHLLISVPPSEPNGDPVFHCHGRDIRDLKSLEWVGYLSTTGVYGDTGGELVNEGAPLAPSSERSSRRVEAEQSWLQLYQQHDLPVHIFRLSGIYGPGRSALDAARRGKARQIVKPDHKFSRIHVDDIAAVISASIERPNPGAIYNVCDDEAAPPAQVTAFACDMLGIDPPPLVSFDEAKKDMSAMALSFWNDNRLVDNSLIRTELAVKLNYPTYREGLKGILAEE